MHVAICINIRTSMGLRERSWLDKKKLGSGVRCFVMGVGGAGFDRAGIAWLSSMPHFPERFF